MSNRATLIAERDFENRGIDASIFSSQPLAVEKHKIEQCGSVKPPADELILGFRLKAETSSFDIYISANDTIVGEKVYKHQNVHLYHKLTILHNGRKVTFF